MNRFILSYFLLLTSFFSLPSFAQNNEDSVKTLGLAGDGLDLYAVLDLFQKSKTIEAFEKDLNLKETGVNNLDLDLDKKVDFIKVVTTQKDASYIFTLQVDVTKTETQDVASILVDKDKNDKVSLQIVGAEALYGKDYVIEPKGNSSVTANPAYTGTDPVPQSVVAQSVILVESAPIVQYVYSPVYVPYVPPYYYGYYPPYHLAFTAIAIGIYHNNCYHYHGGYYGGHYGGGNTIIINNGNRNTINHNTTNTVANNKAKGNYGNNNMNGQGGNRASAGTQPSNNKASASNRSSNASASNRASTGGASNRPTASTKQSGGSGYSNAMRASPSTSNYSSSNRSGSVGASRSMNSGGRSMSGGGMSRGVGGGRRR